MKPIEQKDTGTATDIPASLEATDEQVARFRMDDHLVNLMLHEPFFSQVMVKLNKSETSAVPTAGVMVKDCVPHFVWNPRFVAALDTLKVRGLLKHECYHLIFNHCTQRRQEPHRVWNFATDLAINSIIPRKELPDGGLFPGEALDLAQIKDPARLAKWKKVSDLIESFPVEMAADWYFAELMKDDEVRETIEPEPGDGEPGGMDDHEGWGDMSDEERQVVEGRIKQALAEAAKTDASNSKDKRSFYEKRIAELESAHKTTLDSNVHLQEELVESKLVTTKLMTDLTRASDDKEELEGRIQKLVEEHQRRERARRAHRGGVQLLRHRTAGQPVREPRARRVVLLDYSLLPVLKEHSGDLVVVCHRHIASERSATADPPSPARPATSCAARERAPPTPPSPCASAARPSSAPPRLRATDSRGSRER